MLIQADKISAGIFNGAYKSIAALVAFVESSLVISVFDAKPLSVNKIGFRSLITVNKLKQLKGFFALY